MPTLGYEWQDFGSYRLQYGAGDITFTVSAILVEQDIANNRSKVRREWWYVVHNGGWIASSDTQHYLTGNGWTEAAYWNSGTSDTYVVLLDRTDWISHNDDGTGSFSCWGATWLGGIGQETGWVGQDGISLPTIARASVPTASPNPITITTGTNTLTVNTNRKTSVFTHTVRADVWSFQQTKTGVGESTTFNIPYSVIGSIPNNVLQAEGTIYVKTYNGSTQIGDEKNCKFTLKVNTSHDHPNVGTIAVEDTNTKTSAILSSGQFAYGISTLKATIPLTVSGSYTQLASATVKCGTKTQTYSLSGTSQTITFTYANINASSLTVTVKDKRGTTATKSKSWTLLPYQPVTATASVKRPSATGSTVNGYVSGICYGGTYGSQTNSLNIKVQSKLHSASSYGNTETYTQAISGTGKTTYSKSITFSQTFDYSQEYDIRFEVSDLFSTAVYICRLTQGLPILSWDENEVDVWGNMHIHYKSYPSFYYRVPDSFNGIQYYDGIKNLMPNFPVGTRTINGVTFTTNALGVVTATGTASAQTILSRRFTWGYGTGNFYFSGCADGGSTSTYNVYMWDYGANARPKQWDQSTAIVNCYSTDLSQSRQVYLVNGTEYNMSIRIESGATVSNVKFYPMIRNDSIASNIFVPHAPTNRELMGLLSGALNTSVFTSSSVSVGANATKSVNVSITIPSGYKVKAVTRAWTNGEVLIANCSSPSSASMTSATVWMRNPTSSSVSVTASIEVLFIREEFV